MLKDIIHYLVDSSSHTTTLSPSLTTSKRSVYPYYFYMDDDSQCSPTSATYLSSYNQDAYVEAWSDSNVLLRTPPKYSCTKTYISDYGLSYSFDVGDYINDCDITLEIYDRSSAYGTPMVSEKYYTVAKQHFKFFIT